jgi:hypothetical protein
MHASKSDSKSKSKQELSQRRRQERSCAFSWNPTLTSQKDATLGWGTHRPKKQNHLSFFGNL